MSETAINTKLEHFKYDDKIVRHFVLATLIWGFVGFLLGVYIALELASWKLNLGLQWFTFGRLRPLHTNAAIFAFAGNAVFAGIYYSTQRLLKTRMFSDLLSKIHFWGWQAIIVSAALTLPFGFTQGKEYAELEWPIDIAITVIWVVFAVNFFGAFIKRRERHIFVAIWFYIATIITVALLHIFNSLAIPVTLLKSYSLYSGAQDALVQWWYGHNAVAFVLTTPFLGMMYYFLPKAAERPVYSYRLSIVHFWSLVFIYIWAGPHHLLYTALPDWAQTLGMIFSVSLWAPSWGGMINGLLTLRGAWDRVRREPILKFFVAGVTFYGMSTFEGPLLAIKSVNLVGHYTDWIIGHVHSGTLGWNGFITFGMIYWLLPKLWKKELYSQELANRHFWTATIGILLYIVSMWASGITQGLMWRAMDANGRLMYPDFIQTVIRIAPLYWVRALGGLLYLSGFILMLYNVWMTVKNAPKVIEDTAASAPSLNPVGPEQALNDSPHRVIEGVPAIFSILVLIAVLAGSIIEIVPSLLLNDYFQSKAVIKPYTPLELAGRDIYIREGCYLCHSQMIRPVLPEVARYGTYSRPEESMYDHPFQWGSKRTGPDLAREGNKYPDLWHYRHMEDPRAVTPGSIMPTYKWLLTDKTDFGIIKKKVSVMKFMGVPYTDDEVEGSIANAKAQAHDIGTKLEAQGGQGGVIQGVEDREIVALIAYLQRLGKDLKESMK